MIFPDQSTPESERDDEFYKSHHTYADRLWAQNSNRQARISKAYNAFHGKYSNAKRAEWTDRYKQGGANLSKAKFKHYKLASTKLERLHGEYIKKALRPSAVVTNREALTEKMVKIGHQLAMDALEDVFSQYNQSMGIDFTEGVEKVDMQDPAQVESLNPKLEYEKHMTLTLREQVNRLRLKEIGANTLLDCIIAAECHAVAYIGPNKKVIAERVHPRNSIFEEIENDDFLEDTTLYGYKVEMSQQDIISTYGHKMTKKERESIRTLSNSPETWSGGNTEYFWEKNNEVVGWTQHLQWKTQKEVYEKVEKGVNNEFIDFYENILSKEYYTKNKKQIDREVKAGKYEIRKGYLTTLSESTRIGRDIFLDNRETPFIITRDDDDQVFYNQTGLLFNTVNGKRLSLQEKLYDLDELYDITMWQIRRELGKHKGSATVIDRKYFDESVTENDIMFNLAEEGVVLMNSASEDVQTNPGGSISSTGIASQTIGSMDTLNQLIQMKMDIERMVDRISGMNEFAEGTAPVSSTATQNMQGLAAMRTITSPVFYYHNLFMENFLYRIIELTKYSITYLGDTSFDEILGNDGISIVKKLADVNLHDFGVYLPDPNKEAEQRERLQMWTTTGINSRELQTHIGMEADLSETVQDATKIVREGFALAEKTRKEEHQAQLESQEKNSTAQIEGQKEMHEDSQQHDKDMEILKDDLERGRMTQDAKNKALINAQDPSKQPPPPGNPQEKL